MRIAILDNDVDQIELMRQVLTAAGHACHILPSQSHMLESAHAGDFDLLIMDEDAVDNGIELLHALRNEPGTSVPVLLLAKRSGDADIATLLDAGMTDYAVKPIRRRELEFRVSVLLRRAYPEMGTVAPACFGAYGFDTTAARLTINGTMIDVTRKEFELALLFFRNLGRPLSRTFIREAVWPREPDLMSRTMDTHVSRVRRKLGLLPENGFRLAPVYSYGYRLEQLHN